MKRLVFLIILFLGCAANDGETLKYKKGNFTYIHEYGDSPFMYYNFTENVQLLFDEEISLIWYYNSN